ncbi:MAG: DUF4388 domain-containing protein [Candidatus Methylomirabilales bacterium]
MEFTGRLEGLTVPDILQILGLLKKTGKLTLTRMGSSGVILFRNGEVILATSNSARNSLGNTLIKKEYLTEDALKTALEIQHTLPRWKRLGAILVEQGFVSPAVLDQAIQQHIEQVILEFMEWDTGFFRFEGLEIGNDDISMGIDPEDLVRGELFMKAHDEEAWEEPLKGFEEELEAIFEKMNRTERQSHPRAPVRFTVEYSQAGRMSHGTCLNLSQGGMFIATDRPPAPETEIYLHFAPPTLYRPFSSPARVVWTCPGGENHRATTGMGVQFLGVNPTEAALIGTVVDHLRGQASSPDSPRSFPSSQKN